MRRVDAFVSKYGGESMPELPMGMPSAQKMALNRAWIKKCMNEGYTIYDLGPSIERTNWPFPTGSYYRMERFELTFDNYFDRWIKLGGFL